MEEQVLVIQETAQLLEPGQLLVAGLSAHSVQRALADGLALRRAGAQALLMFPPFDVRAYRRLTTHACGARFFRALMRNPRLADRVRQLGDSIRFENTLPPALREFVILIVARHWSAHYEWHAHSTLASSQGVARETIDAIGQGRKPGSLSDEQALLYTFCTETLHDKDISDSTYAAALQRFGETTLLDVLCTVGYFGFVSVILNAIRAPVPAGGAVLPAREV